MRNFRSEGRSRDRRDTSRQMYDAVCSQCGNRCKVPFRPTGSKPVFCSDCFEKQNGGSSPRRDDRSPSPRFNNDQSITKLTDRIETLNNKLDKIIILMTRQAEVEVKAPKKRKASITA